MKKPALILLLVLMGWPVTAQKQYLVGTLVSVADGDKTTITNNVQMPVQLGGGSIPLTFSSQAFYITVQLPELLCVGVITQPMADLIVGDSIYVRFDGDLKHMYVRRPNGKEYKTRVVRRTRTEAPRPEPAPPGPAAAPAPAAPTATPSSAPAAASVTSQLAKLVPALGLPWSQPQPDLWVVTASLPSGGTAPVGIHAVEGQGLVSLMALVAENYEWPLSSDTTLALLRMNGMPTKMRTFIDTEHRYMVKLDEAIGFIDQGLFRLMVSRVAETAAEVKAAVAPIATGKPSAWVADGGERVYHARSCSRLNGKAVHRVLSDLTGYQPCAVCRH